MEYTRLFLNDTDNVEKANPIIYALFCAVGIPANVLIIIGTAFPSPVTYVYLLWDPNSEVIPDLVIHGSLLGKCCVSTDVKSTWAKPSI